MTFFDYVVAIILVLSLLLSVWRGVVGELMVLAGWVVAFFASREFARDAGNVVAASVAEPALRTVLGFAVVFVLVLVLMAIARFLLRRLMKAAGLGVTDRVLGLAFGFARGAVIVLALVMVGGMTSLPRETWWRNATLSPPCETAVLAIKPWLPADVAKRVRFRS